MEFIKGVFLFILVVIMFAIPTCGKAITCTAGDFAVGEVGFILSYFPDDIDSHYSVIIHDYPFNAPTDASAKTAGVTPAGEGDRDSDEVDERQDSSAKTVHPDETGTVSVCTLVRVIVAVIFVPYVVCMIILVIILRLHHPWSRERLNCMLGMHILNVVFYFTLLVVIMLATPTRGKAITCTAGDFAAGEVDETGTVSVCTLVRVIVAVIFVPYFVCMIILVIILRLHHPWSRERFATTRTCGKAITCTTGDVAADETGTVSVCTLVVVIVAVIVINAVDYIITVVTLFLPRRQRSPEKLLGMKFLEGVFPLILAVIMLATRTCGKAITCTAGDFAVGDIGSILCYFPDDIDNHQSVFVQYYPSSAPTDASGVFLCKTEDVEASKCKEQDGYVLKSHTRNTLLIEIINITEKAAGRYNCQFLPPDRSPREMCSLTVRAKTAGVTPAEEGDHDSDVLDEGKDSSTKIVHPGTESVSTPVGVFVAVNVVAAVLCIILIIIGIVFRLRRRRSPEILVEKRSTQTQVTDDSLHRAYTLPLIHKNASATRLQQQEPLEPHLFKMTEMSWS